MIQFPLPAKMKRVRYENKLLTFYLFYSFFVSRSSNASNNFTAQLCLPDQSSALLQLKQEFILQKPDFSRYYIFHSDPSYPKTKSWKSGSDCCFWDGVTCNMETGEVIGLDLSSSWLNGPINSNSSIFSLSHLQNLNLAFNNFNSSVIPSKFSHFVRLMHLNLSHSMLSGQIPEEVSKLSNLISLDLSSCDFDGDFPINFFFLPKIETIDVSNNYDLSGFIPEFHHVSSLRSLILSHTSFIGKLPDTIGNLSSLNELYLIDCLFSGSIPFSIANLSMLVHLDLSDNVLSGQIPSSMVNLQKLSFLSLSSNFFNGEILYSLANLTQLTFLDLSYNNFSGQFPSSMVNLQKLSVLSLPSNHFNGEIPHSIGNLTQLTSLDLSYNDFNGQLPSSLFAMLSLFDLDLAQNQLNGPLEFPNVSSLENLDLSSKNFGDTLEFQIFFGFKHLQYLCLSGINLKIRDVIINSTLPKLTDLYLSSCNISEFPDFLRTQSELESLDLSNNKIEGLVPKWFWNVGTKTLTSLNLSHNFLSTFEEPLSILPWKNMQTFDLHSNKLQGLLSIPLLSTQYYFVSNNQFSGELPPTICECNALEILDLSNNNLSGMIPHCLGNFSKVLSALNLQGNNFHGLLPQTFINGGMTYLDVSHNNLEGKVPRSLVNCENLETLNLGHNQINDTFPFWLENLPNLQVLILRANNFYGSIWQSDNNSCFSKLQVIDLSSNNFTGRLHLEFLKNWKAITMEQNKNGSELKYFGDDMRYYSFSVTVTNKGGEMLLERILTTFKAIDLSNNKFQGEIPDFIGNLRGLMVLNLSRNAFTGHIPLSLSNLRELESLDISQNKLSGEIPPQLGSLTFLGYLNVSQNQLTGPIPQGGQVGRFSESSFQGNSGLCGLPLSQKCKNDRIEPTSTLEQYQEADSNTKIDQNAMWIGCAFGLMNGVIIGHLITSKLGWFENHVSRKRESRRQ